MTPEQKRAVRVLWWDYDDRHVSEDDDKYDRAYLLTFLKEFPGLRRVVWQRRWGSRILVCGEDVETFPSKFNEPRETSYHRWQRNQGY